MRLCRGRPTGLCANLAGRSTVDALTPSAVAITTTIGIVGFAFPVSRCWIVRVAPARPTREALLCQVAAHADPPHIRGNRRQHPVYDLGVHHAEVAVPTVSRTRSYLWVLRRRWPASCHLERVGMRDSRPLASDVIVLVPCPRCGTTSPVDVRACPLMRGRSRHQDVLARSARSARVGISALPTRSPTRCRPIRRGSSSAPRA